MYVDRINIWPGLREFRNWILAHKYQIDDHPAFIPPWAMYRTGRVPSRAAEWLLLLDCVRQASAAVMAFYGDVYRTLAPVLDPGTQLVPIKGARTGDEAEQERYDLAARMNEQLLNLGVRLDDAVFREYECRPPGAPGR